MFPVSPGRRHEPDPRHLRPLCEPCRQSHVLEITMPGAPKVIACCSLAILLALYVVGAVSATPGSLRHEVQTLPLWFPIVLGFRQRDIAKWMALPLMVFWLAIMILIWLFLLGWARVVSGQFFPTEIAMTIVIGVACAIGLVLRYPVENRRAAWDRYWRDTSVRAAAAGGVPDQPCSIHRAPIASGP